MRITRKAGLLFAAGLALVFAADAGFAASRFDEYHDRSEVASELAAMAREHPGLASIGVSKTNTINRAH